MGDIFIQYNMKNFLHWLEVNIWLPPKSLQTIFNIFPKFKILNERLVYSQ